MQHIIDNLEYLNNETLRSLRLSLSYMKDKDDPISLGHKRELRHRIDTLTEFNNNLRKVIN